ncbi:MAG: hypothetical protein ACYC7E_14285 [Armatimonadota bacterium]
MNWKRLVNIGMKLAAIGGALYAAYWPLAHITLDDDEFQPVLYFPRPWRYLDFGHMLYWECLLIILLLILWSLSAGTNRLSQFQRFIALTGALLMSLSLGVVVRSFLLTRYSLELLPINIFYVNLIATVEVLCVGALLYYGFPESKRNTVDACWLLRQTMRNTIASFGATLVLFIPYTFVFLHGETTGYEYGLLFVALQQTIFIILFVISIIGIFIRGQKESHKISLTDKDIRDAINR